jgi:uncharacterized protein
MNARPSPAIHNLSVICPCASSLLSVLTLIGFLLSVLLALAGCSLPQAQSDPTRFYVLSAEASRAAPSSNGAPLPVLYLRDIELASYLRNRPMIVRRGENEIEFREFALWGEPLDLGVARVVREELLARGAVSTVLTSAARREQASADATLSIRVLACEGVADGTVAFRAMWDIATAGPKPSTAAGGEYRPMSLRWDGKTEASLAAQLSQAVAGLADEIAAALAKK